MIGCTLIDPNVITAVYMSISSHEVVVCACCGGLLLHVQLWDFPYEYTINERRWLGWFISQRRLSLKLEAMTGGSAGRIARTPESQCGRHRRARTYLAISCPNGNGLVSCGAHWSGYRAWFMHVHVYTVQKTLLLTLINYLKKPIPASGIFVRGANNKTCVAPPLLLC